MRIEQGTRLAYSGDRRVSNSRLNGATGADNQQLSLVCADKGAPPYFVSIVEDITQLK